MARKYKLGTVRRLVNTMAKNRLRKGKGPAGTYILTTTGRKTGLARLTPVTLMSDEGERWIVAPYGAVGWVHNLRASGTATLERGGIVETITVTELSAEAAAPVLAEYHARLKRLVGPFMDVPRSGASEAHFLAVADQHPVFQIDTARHG